MMKCIDRPWIPGVEAKENIDHRRLIRRQGLGHESGMTRNKRIMGGHFETIDTPWPFVRRDRSNFRWMIGGIAM